MLTAVFSISLGLAFLGAISGGGNKVATEVSATDYSQIIDGISYKEYDPLLIGQQSFTKRTAGGFITNTYEQWPEWKGSEYKSFTRFVVNAETAGKHKVFFKLGVQTGNQPNAYISDSAATRAANNHQVSCEKPIETTAYSGVDNYYEFDFKQGKNVFLVEYIWNATEFKRILLPESVTPVDTNEPQTYYGMNADVNSVVFLSSSDLFNPDAIMDMGQLYPENYTDGNLHYAPNSSMTFTINEGTDFEVTAFASNSSSAAKTLNYVIDNGSTQTYSVPANANNTSFSLGNLSAGAHTIKFSAASDDAGPRLTVHKLTTTLLAPVTTLSISEIRQQTKILGRTFADTNYIALDYSLSGLEFDYVGGGYIFADFDIISNSNNTRFAVEIDYNDAFYVTVASRVAIATNLDDGFHHIAFYKTSEAYGNQINLVSLSCTQGGVISKPVDHKVKLEVIGDSISCGIGISSTDNENAYESYAMKLARELNADISDISVNGKGLVNSWDIANGLTLGGPQMPEIWSKTLFYRDQSISYDNSYDADIVVVNLGNNDSDSNSGVTVQQFEAKMDEFNTTLKQAYGEDTTIIWTYGAFTNRTWLQFLKSYIEGKNDTHLKYAALPLLKGGANNHPSATEHNIIASILGNVYSYKGIEAEDYIVSGKEGYERTQTNANWSNDKYIGNMEAGQPYVKFTYDAAKDGQYMLRIIGNGQGGNIVYQIDDNSVVYGAVAYTTEMDNWHPTALFAQYVEVAITLTQGVHTITLYAPNNGGWLNFDFIEVFPVNAVLSSKGELFSKAFMNDTHYECAASLEGDGFEETVWKNLKLRYQTLTSEEKTAIAQDQDLVDRYSAVLRAHTSFDNFLENGQGNALLTIPMANVNESNNFNIVVVIVISFVAVFALAIIMHKSRKE